MTQGDPRSLQLPAVCRAKADTTETRQVFLRVGSSSSVTKAPQTIDLAGVIKESDGESALEATAEGRTGHPLELAKGCDFGEKQSTKCAN